jgi:hypothetical protein
MRSKHARVSNASGTRSPALTAEAEMVLTNAVIPSCSPLVCTVRQCSECDTRCEFVPSLGVQARNTATWNVYAINNGTRARCVINIESHVRDANIVKIPPVFDAHERAEQAARRRYPVELVVLTASFSPATCAIITSERMRYAVSGSVPETQSQNTCSPIPHLLRRPSGLHTQPWNPPFPLL